ncbi:MAG: hypothetical protein Q9M35_03910 [Rhodothermus sp.]|nr:hypothetical protein [Rhodothermus sp.]
MLQTKCGIRFKDDPPGAPQRYDFDGFISNYVDVLLLHRPDLLMEPEEVVRCALPERQGALFRRKLITRLLRWRYGRATRTNRW